MKSLEFLRKMNNFVHGEMRDLREHISQESMENKTGESFANFLKAENLLNIKELNNYQGHKTQHLSMKKHGICEISVFETAKSCEINALGFKEKSSYDQMTSSKSFI